jgi:hypothetical protein
MDRASAHGLIKEDGMLNDNPTAATAAAPVSPAAALGADLAALRVTIDTARANAALAGEEGAITTLAATVAALQQRFEGLSLRPEADVAALQPRITALVSGFAAAEAASRSELVRRREDLAQRVQAADLQLNQVVALAGSPETAAPLLALATTSARDLDNQVNAAREAVDKPMSEIRDAVSGLAATLDSTEAVLAWFDRSATKLSSGEKARRAVETVRGEAGGRGALYLTSMRLWFDPPAGGSASDAFASSLSDLTSIRATKEGFLGHEDHVWIAKSGGPEIDFHLFGQDSHGWEASIREAMAAAVPPA